MFHKTLCCILTIAVFSMGIQESVIACSVRELVPAQDDDCPDWDDGCSSGVYTIPQYYRCASAGSGESGKQCCDSTFSQIATFYPCEEDIHWTSWVICALGVVGCLGAGALCAIDPSKASCAVAISACGLAGMACFLGDYADCEKGDSQSCYRNVFQQLRGDTCTG